MKAGDQVAIVDGHYRGLRGWFVEQRHHVITVALLPEDLNSRHGRREIPWKRDADGRVPMGFAASYVAPAEVAS
ncbi:MAG TPA: hypothetical protein VFZ21_25980 [Gemmatimonadaceae bacterium]|nr:hypothetical protein [Gemmatimonadaceae bacterium]